MRIMAGDAVHFAFGHRVALRQVKLSLRFQVTLKTGRRVVPRIQDEPAASAARRHVPASGTVTALATRLSGQGGRFNMKARMGAGGKRAHVIRVTVKADGVAHKSRAFDRWRRRESDFAG